jgi:hypothetical protein
MYYGTQYIIMSLNKINMLREVAWIVLYPFNRENFMMHYENSARTSQETRHVSATKPSRLILFREIIAVYCENHTEHINKLCLKCRFCQLQKGGTHSNHCVLKA